MLRGMQSVSETVDGVKGRRGGGQGRMGQRLVLQRLAFRGENGGPTCLSIMFQPLMARCFDRGPAGKRWLWN